MAQTHGGPLTGVVAEFERPLLAYVHRLLGDRHRGEEIVQEAFLQLLRQPTDQRVEKLGPWLFTVCRRKVIDTLRKEHRMTALSEAAEPCVATRDPAATAETNDTAAAVVARLAHLPPNQQEAIRLKFQEQFSYREIAQVMGISETYVGVLLHHAISTLRQSFTPGAAS